MTINDALVTSAVITPLLTASLVWVNQRNATRAEKKVEEVKQTLITTNSTMDGKLNTIHTLVNSKLGRVLRTNASTLRALAVLTQDPSYAKLADDAEAESADHEAKQAAVDANGKDKQ
jgi:hypothetical protein